MIDKFQNVVLDVVSRVVIPAVQLFAMYVIFHGHYSPGGGFQGGVLLAGSIILLTLTRGQEESSRLFPPSAALYLMALGMLIFLVTGFLPVVVGGAFLDYGYLPFSGISKETLRYYGILVVEIGIAMIVWGALVTIFDQIGRMAGDV